MIAHISHLQQKCPEKRKLHRTEGNRGKWKAGPQPKNAGKKYGKRYRQRGVATTPPLAGRLVKRKYSYARDTLKMLGNCVSQLLFLTPN
jgi:hypothetical protein